MDASALFNYRIASGCLAFALAACVLVPPCAAYADETGTEGTAVYVSIERTLGGAQPGIVDGELMPVQRGDLEEAAEGASAASASRGLLPKTGDQMGVYAFAIAIVAASAAVRQLGWIRVRQAGLEAGHVR